MPGEKTPTVRRATTRRAPVPASLAYDAAEHIVARRVEHAGEQVGVEPDDPAAVAEYARRHTDRLPAWICAADALDQLTIYEWADRELARRRRDAIRLGRRAGATWTQIADAIRVGSAQGANQYWLRLEEYLDGPDHRRDVDAARERLSPAPAETTPGEYGGLRDALRQLLDVRDQLPDDVSEAFGAYRREVTRRAEIPDVQLARELRLLLEDLVDVVLPRAVLQAADRLACAVMPDGT